jgi:hypothetical protein
LLGKGALILFISFTFARHNEKRQSAAALQNVAVIAGSHYSLASRSALVFRRFGQLRSDIFGRMSNFANAAIVFSIGKPTTFVNEPSIFAMISAPLPCAA